MHIWSALAAREAALLLVLVLLGAGPASLLSARFDAGSRIALSAVLGFALGTCVTTTLLQFAPTNDTYWVLIPLALASCALAAVRTVRDRDAPPWRRRLPLGDLAALVLVGLAVAGPVTYVLHERHTVGPGAYYFTDVDNYVAEQDAARTVDLAQARHDWKSTFAGGSRYGNQTEFAYAYIANAGSNLDATPLDSSVNALLGMPANDTWAPFLTVLLLAGALGAFAAVRHFTRSRTLTAALGGALFGGPMFLELWFDSYQAAIVAIGIVVPALVLFDDALARPRWPTYGLIALLLGAMLTVYPLYMALLVGAGILMLLWRGNVMRQGHTPLRSLLRPVGRAVAAIVLLTIAFDLVGFIRDIRYYREVASGLIPFPRVGYQLPLSVLPGWVGQTREFWNMPPLGSASAGQLILGLILPLVFAGVVLVGLRRFGHAWSLVAMAAICAVVAEYSFVSQQSCTYCAERNLLPLTPIAAVLIAVGLWALFTMPAGWTKVAAVAGAVIVVLAVGERTRVELTRVANASYFLDSADRSALAHAPRSGSSIEEEGFMASVFAQAEQPLVYHLINEHAPGRASVILGTDLANAIQYLDFGPVQVPPSATFDPHYRYVLTRLPAIATDRRLIARSQGIALEERTDPLDITPFNGLATPFNRIDPSGTAWAQPFQPLQFAISGPTGGRPVYAQLRLRAAVSIDVPRQRGVRSRLTGQLLTLCVAATGHDPIHVATVTVKSDSLPAPPPAIAYPPPMPEEGLALTAMRAVTGRCSLA